jgi:hypothetical protein
MDSSLERIRAKIAEFEVKLADLRIAERELMALERAPARKTTAPRTLKVKPKRTQKENLWIRSGFRVDRPGARKSSAGMGES